MLSFKSTSLRKNKVILSETKEKISLILLIYIFQQASIFIIINRYPTTKKQICFLFVRGMHKVATQGKFFISKKAIRLS